MSVSTHPLTFIDPECGRPSFHTVSVPLPTDPIIAHRFERLDGAPVGPLDSFVCQSCRRWFGHPIDFQWLTDAAYYVKRSA